MKAHAGDVQAVIAPIIHLNGDRAAVLVQRLEAAYDVLGDALKALSETAPNARNYYPDPGRYDQARAQFERRANLLHGIRDELIAELEGIQAQRGGTIT